jgi:hypothetical protein
VNGFGTAIRDKSGTIFSIYSMVVEHHTPPYDREGKVCIPYIKVIAGVASITPAGVFHLDTDFQTYQKDNRFLPYYQIGHIMMLEALFWSSFMKMGRPIAVDHNPALKLKDDLLLANGKARLQVTQPAPLITTTTTCTT